MNREKNQQINQTWVQYYLSFTVYRILHIGLKKLFWYHITNRYVMNVLLSEPLWGSTLCSWKFKTSHALKSPSLNINTSPFGKPMWFTTAFQHQQVFLCRQLIIIVTGSYLFVLTDTWKKEKMSSAAFLKVWVKTSLTTLKKRKLQASGLIHTSYVCSGQLIKNKLLTSSVTSQLQEHMNYNAM